MIIPIDRPSSGERLLHTIAAMERRITLISTAIADHGRGEHDRWTQTMTRLANRWMLKLDELYEARHEDEQ